MTALLQLRSISSTLPSPSLGGDDELRNVTQAPLTTAFSALARLDESTSGALVAPRVSLTSAWTSQTKPRRPEAPSPIPPPLRQQERLSRPKAPSIDKVLPAIFHREPATGPAALPPEVRLPTLFRPSYDRDRSRKERLDPQRLRGLFARGREDHAPLVDFCNRKRLPSTTARSIKPRSPRPGSPLSSAMSAGGRAPFRAQPAELSRVRGRRG